MALASAIACSPQHSEPKTDAPPAPVEAPLPMETPAAPPPPGWQDASSANVARVLYNAEGATIRLSCLGPSKVLRVEALYPQLVDAIPGESRMILTFDGGELFSTVAIQAREAPYRLAGDYPAKADIVTAFMTGARVEIALSHASAGSSTRIDLDGAVNQFATNCTQISGLRGGR
jgi:hypothetical protein